jgi:hypothetical protein
VQFVANESKHLVSQLRGLHIVRSGIRLRLPQLPVMDEPREIDDKFLQLEFKKRIATLPGWNIQSKLVIKVQKVVGSTAKTVEVLVDGVDTTIWPNWIVDGVNPMLLSDKVRKQLGIEAWWL